MIIEGVDRKGIWNIRSYFVVLRHGVGEWIDKLKDEV